MTTAPNIPSPHRPVLAWMCLALAGIVAPALAILLMAGGSQGAAKIAPVAALSAIGMMGSGMIGAAVAGRFAAGFALALASGAGLAGLALLLGIAELAQPASMGLAMIVAAISFAARGALFARSVQARGWWIALAVVGGEGAMLFVAWAQPDALPAWLLALLPAQWASTALRTALTGPAPWGAGWELAALIGTACATLLVARLWPRRWPYLIMFTVWLGLSALVLHRPDLPGFDADHAPPAAAR